MTETQKTCFEALTNNIIQRSSSKIEPNPKMKRTLTDPPEQPEPPECCGDYMDVTGEGACVCPRCGKRIEPRADIDPAVFVAEPVAGSGGFIANPSHA